MNKQIELIKKWLADPESVSQEELEVNYSSAWAAYIAVDIAAAARVARAAYAAYRAADNAANDDAASAEYWIKKYEELTK